MIKKICAPTPSLARYQAACLAAHSGQSFSVSITHRAANCYTVKIMAAPRPFRARFAGDTARSGIPL